MGIQIGGRGGGSSTIFLLEEERGTPGQRLERGAFQTLILITGKNKGGASNVDNYS